MFLSAHYAGEDMVLKIQPNEPWKKVFGPVFIYVNSVPGGSDQFRAQLWDDAKMQVKISEHKLSVLVNFTIQITA